MDDDVWHIPDSYARVGILGDWDLVTLIKRTILAQYFAFFDKNHFCFPFIIQRCIGTVSPRRFPPALTGDGRGRILPKLMRLATTNLQVIGDELAIVWSDGVESYIKFETLRRHCPCAGCGGEPDILGHVEKPNVTYTEASFRMRSHHLVGGYAWQPTWEDGHGTGLFSFDFLRRLAAAPAVNE